jgi:hypothetical protein
MFRTYCCQSSLNQMGWFGEDIYSCILTVWLTTSETQNA